MGSIVSLEDYRRRVMADAFDRSGSPIEGAQELKQRLGQLLKQRIDLEYDMMSGAEQSSAAVDQLRTALEIEITALRQQLTPAASSGDRDNGTT